MERRHAFHVVGVVVAATGAAMLVPLVTSLIYREWEHAGWFALAAFVTAAAGFGASRAFGRPGELTPREGFAAVGLSWFAMSAFGMLPYLLTGSVGNVTDAFFETASGFTTTGASVVPDPAVLSHGVLIWRALTQWMGGMGIIVLSIAILPLLGVGGVELARAESPGPMPDRLTPRFRETAKRLWLVYLGLTGVEAALLWAGDMSLFEAMAHTLTTMSTGGFSTSAGSLGAFSAYAQWVVIFFMILAGASFALHFRALRRPVEYLRHAEFRLYMGILAVASVVMLIGLWGDDLGTIVKDSIFTTVSIVTTTGYATADFGAWVPALQVLVLGLMFVGGMAGSTGGAVKPYRLGVLYQASRADLRRVIHPKGVFLTRFGKESVSDAIVESVQSFFLLYMFLFMTGTLALAIISDATGHGTSLVTSVSAVASTLGNFGPGLDSVGPTSNYLLVPAPGKWLLSFLMIAGRLEIFPVILLLTRELWRK
ncbi:MAG: TrkH family potassium uptake protein [Acidimicrobiia bacterium]